MADQADFPDVYVDESVAPGGVGSQADPYSDFSEINWTTGGDNSIFDYYAGSPAASATINLQKGETWNEVLDLKVDGTATYPLKAQAYGAGANPIIRGVADLTSATYKWTTSNAGANNEWYCEIAAGGDPSLEDSHLLLLNGTAATESNALVDVAPDLGNLNDHEWGYGDNDALGYDTFYFRDDSGDPDTSGVLLETPVQKCIRVYAMSYITVDGIDANNGYNPSGSLFVTGGCDHVTVKNLEASWNGYTGIVIGTGTNCTVDNCTTSYNGGHNISATSGTGNTFSNNTSHHCRATSFNGGTRFTGYGLKFLAEDSSKMFGNATYLNDYDGINLDISTVGCTDCEIYENLIYDNWQTGILIEQQTHRTKVYRNFMYDNNTTGKSSVAEISIIQYCHDTEIYNNIIYKTKANDSGTGYHPIDADQYSSGDGCEGTLVYNNTLDGGGYSLRGVILRHYSTPKNSKIFNNIIFGINTAGVAWQADGTDYTGFEADYNCMKCGTIPDTIIKYPGTSSKTLITARAAGVETHGMEADPLFTDGGSHDYTLASNSPCIDTGVDLGASYSEALDPHSTWPDGVATADQDDYGLGWEIGAYLFLETAGAGLLTLTIDSAGKPIVYEGVDARITGSNADVVTGDDCGLIVDDTDVSLFVEGTQISTTYSSLGADAGTQFEMQSIGTAGATDSIELFPRDVEDLLPKELV